MKKILILLLPLLTVSLVEGSALSVRRVRSGIIIVDTGANVRALEPYKGCPDGGSGYARIVNKYRQTFPNQRVYCMVIPNAIAYYCPDTARAWTRQERPVIEAINRQLEDGVQTVDVYPTLQQHLTEPIYSRTDHHWSPLGAYYAAQEFARSAGVPFKSLNEYEPRVIRDYVGSMYTFSRDDAVKQAPEEFVYYVPCGIDFTATRICYNLTKNRSAVASQKEPEEFGFFREYADGSSAAYCTFMGGDTNTTSVRTSTPGSRRLLILKDSYGNALPGYLFGSFQEIHVVDCRYFTQNIVKFVDEHQITDILFANNLVHASMARTCETYDRYLRQ